MKLFFFSIAIATILLGCTEEKIVKKEDYQWALKPAYLNKVVEERQAELTFWSNRLKRDTGSFVDMLEIGYNYLSLFKLKGRMADLKAGELWIQKASQKLNYSDPDILQTLSQVFIMGHRFSEAQVYIIDANKKGGSPYIHQLLSFDAGMELGKYQEAKKALSRLKDQTAFNFLIRKAKYEDHTGNSAEAISLMEQAFDKIKASNKKELYCWTLSNLGDMYGHSGRISEAYEAYVNVLKKDPSYLYALKGIARILYAHDGNAVEAKKVLHFILSQTNLPELYLILAEIAEYEQDVVEKKKYIQQFMRSIGHSGDMYNKYLIELYASELDGKDKALAIAEREIKSRPTPETFSWLAWAFYCKSDLVKANNIYKTYVSGRTFEPESLYKGAFIHAANGEHEKAKELFKKCNESSFELGPLKLKRGKEMMDNM
jgi:tetratricopeptide (TPR) repeat protein